MKYIKTFENINNYKRYIIYPTASSPYLYILEVLQEDDSFIILRKSYRYGSLQKSNGGSAFGIKGLEELDGTTIQFTPERMKNAVYQSDNIQDCLDKLPVIKNMMKYNII